MSSRWTRRIGAALLLVAMASSAPEHVALARSGGSTDPTGGGLAAGFGVTAVPTDPNDGVAWANHLRSFGENLAPITTSAELSAPPQRHADWLAAFHAAGDPYCAHGQDATHTWPAGEDHSHNVLFCGPTSIGAAIQGWVDTPYHGAGFVDPTTAAIGFGFAGDTSTGWFAGGGAPAVSRWPKPGGVLPSPAMTSGEIPEPRTACGYASGPVGRPIFLTLPAAAVFGGSSITGPNGAVVQCALFASPFEGGAPLLDQGEATRQVALLAQSPYTVGQTYTATVVMDGLPYTWSFLVGDVPSAPVVTAVASGDGQVTVVWQPADGHGSPVTSYLVENVTTGQSQVVAAPATATAFGGLTPGSGYSFRVKASNDLGDGPSSLGAAIALATPAAPSIVTAIPGSASAFLSWSFSSTAAAPVTGFQLEVDGGAPIDVGYGADYTLSDLLAGHTYSLRVRGTNAAGGGAWSEPRSVTPRAPGVLFHGLPVPRRALDSREGPGPIAAGGARAVQVVSVTGAAAEAVAAISINLTATGATGPGYFTAWPCNQPQPDASSLNFAGREPGVPNHVIVPVAPDGTICIAAGAHSADVIVDVDGWFSFGAGLQPESPRRALDTRLTTGPTTDVAVPVVTPGARAAIVNLTAAGGSGAPGFVTAYACGSAAPLASNLNFAAGQIVANAAVVPVAADGSLCLHANTPTDLIVDVAGAVTDNFVAIGPNRLLDTRSGTGATTSVAVEAGPSGAAGAVLNVTAAGGSAVAGYATVHPADVGQPATSNLNFSAGQIVPNAVVVHPDPAGLVQLSASTPVQFVVDTFGYFL